MLGLQRMEHATPETSSCQNPSQRWCRYTLSPSKKICSNDSEKKAVTPSFGPLFSYVTHFLFGQILICTFTFQLCASPTRKLQLLSSHLFLPLLLHSNHITSCLSVSQSSCSMRPRVTLSQSSSRLDLSTAAHYSRVQDINHSEALHARCVVGRETNMLLYLHLFLFNFLCVCPLDPTREYRLAIHDYHSNQPPTTNQHYQPTTNQQPTNRQ